LRIRDEVTFRKGKVFIKPGGSGGKMDKMIGVREEKVYRLQV
jgi:PHP family Zn ribbon phosphoesterase